MTTQLDQNPVDQTATVLIIDGDQLLLVSSEAAGLVQPNDLLPPEYHGLGAATAVDARPRLPRVRQQSGPQTLERDEIDLTSQAPTRETSPQQASSTQDALSSRRTVASAIRVGIGETAHDSTGVQSDARDATEHHRFAERRESIADSRRSRRRRTRARLVFGSVAVVCCGLALVASPILRVQDVEIVGINALSQESVLRSMAVGERPSMLTLKVDDLETRLTDLPLIHSAEVWKEWPNRLVVHVSERSPVATIRSNGGWLVLDQHGGVLETRTVRPDLPLLDLGGREVAEGSKDINSLLKVASAASARLRQQIDTLAVQDGGVTVRMRAGAISAADVAVRIGHADDVEAKLRALETMADESTAVSFDGVATLDLTVADQPALIPKSVPAPAAEAAPGGGADVTSEAGGGGLNAQAGTSEAAQQAQPATGTLPNNG